jgi:hypothetical protein
MRTDGRTDKANSRFFETLRTRLLNAKLLLGIFFFFCVVVSYGCCCDLVMLIRLCCLLHVRWVCGGAICCTEVHVEK